MAVESNDSLLERLKHFTKIVSFAVSLLGCLVLLGWTFDVEFLKRIAPSLVAMNPATAIAFILAGISLWCLRDESSLRRAMARLSARGGREGRADI
jgi:hypothetical protein